MAEIVEEKGECQTFILTEMTNKKSIRNITMDNNANEVKPDKATTERLKKELLNSTLEVMSYTQEEIYAILPPDEAEEFIELRKRVLANIGNTATDDDLLLSTAADDPAPYN